MCIRDSCSPKQGSFFGVGVPEALVIALLGPELSGVPDWVEEAEGERKRERERESEFTTGWCGASLTAGVPLPPSGLGFGRLEV